MTEYHSVVTKIQAVLKDRGVWFETFEHEAVRTSKEASKIRTGYTIDHGAKALIVRVKHPTLGKHFVMIVVPGSQKFDASKLKALYGFTDIRFASEEEVSTITSGVLPGGVPPFGNLFELTVYVDVSLFLNEKMVFNAGDKRYSIAMLTADYRTLVAPVVGEIV